MSFSKEEVLMDIRYVIANQYLKDVQIESNNQEIISKIEKKIKEEKIKTHSLVCNACGAMNTITVESQACEYCGTIIS